MYFWPIGDILFRKLLYPIGFQQILLLSEKNVCEKHFLVLYYAIYNALH